MYMQSTIIQCTCTLLLYNVHVHVPMYMYMQSTIIQCTCTLLLYNVHVHVTTIIQCTCTCNLLLYNVHVIYYYTMYM